jgi:hypothetical protein
MIDGGGSRLRANIKQYTDIGLENRPKGIEKPPANFESAFDMASQNKDN